MDLTFFDWNEPLCRPDPSSLVYLSQLLQIHRFALWLYGHTVRRRRYGVCSCPSQHQSVAMFCIG